MKDLYDMNQKELYAECERLGLKPYGTKKEMITRIEGKAMEKALKDEAPEVELIEAEADQEAIEKKKVEIITDLEKAEIEEKHRAAMAEARRLKDRQDKVDACNEFFQTRAGARYSARIENDMIVFSGHVQGRVEITLNMTKAQVLAFARQYALKKIRSANTGRSGPAKQGVTVADFQKMPMQERNRLLNDIIDYNNSLKTVNDD